MTRSPGKGRSLPPGLAGGSPAGRCDPAPPHPPAAPSISGARRDGTGPEGAAPGRPDPHRSGTERQATTGKAAPNTTEPGAEIPRRAARLRTTGPEPSLLGKSPMDCGHFAESSEISSPGSDHDSLLPSAAGGNSCPVAASGPRAGAPPGRPAAANAARERSRVQTLRHAFLELQKTLPSVPPDTKLSKLDVLLLATTYIAHLTRSLQDEEESPGEGLGALRGDGYLHPVKKWPMRSRLYIGATGQFLTHSAQGDGANQGEASTTSQI